MSSRTRTKNVRICNRKGLHARAAAKFVKRAEQFNARITVRKDGTEVDGTSIMGLMLLSAAKGDTITLKAAGAEADAAIAALSDLVGGLFEESE